MNPWHFVARQLAHPHGLFGKLVIGRLLDRANVADNELVYQTLDPDPTAQFLEVGFGGGALLFRIAAMLDGGHLDGVDVSAEMLAVARGKVARKDLAVSIGLQLAGVDALPFADASFDCAYSVHTLYFWPDLDRGLAELARVVKPGGKLLLGYSSEEALIADGATERGFTAYSNQRLSDACRAHGFAAEQLNSSARKRGGQFHVYRGIRSGD